MRLGFLILIVLSVCTTSFAQKSDIQDTFQKTQQNLLPHRDSLIGEDKVDHFLVSAYIAAFTYYILKEEVSTSHQTAAIIGASFSFSIGLGKELNDKRHGKGTASLKDILANVAGITVGLLIFSNG